MPLTISLIAALADNGVIGRDNTLPWRLPEDLKYFRAMTIGKPVLMGRKTWESLGRPLPGRTNIVMTRQRDFVAVGAEIVDGMDAAISLATQIAQRDGVDECVVIGGAEIYAQALPLCTRMYLTEVHAVVDGDAFFPAFDRNAWQETKRDRHLAAGENPFDYSFVVLERIRR